MKYKFCSIHINVTKYDVTFATKEWVLTPNPVATPLVGSLNRSSVYTAILIVYFTKSLHYLVVVILSI